MNKTIKNNILSRIVNSVLLLLSISLVSACSSGGGSTPPENPDGVYQSGTGTLDGTSVNDITAIVYNNRIIAFSVTAQVLIDGTIDSVTGSNYTATVKVYKDGVTDNTDVAVTGTVTGASSLTGTLNGTGLGSGNFSLTFSLASSNSAAFSNIASTPANPWYGNVYSAIPGTSTDQLEIDPSGTYFFEISASGGFCDFDGTVAIPDASVNIYSINQAPPSPDLSTHTDCSSVAYSGFMSLVNNQLIYVATNGADSLFGVFDITP